MILSSSPATGTLFFILVVGAVVVLSRLPDNITQLIVGEGANDLVGGNGVLRHGVFFVEKTVSAHP